MKNHLFSRWICLGALFAPSAKRTNFRAPAHAKLQEKHVQKQPPRRVETNLKNIDFGPPNGSNILTKSLPEAYRRPLAPQDAPKSSKPRPKRPQERAKSAPRAPGSDFHDFPGLTAPQRDAVQAWGSGFGGVAPPETAFSLGGLVDFLVFRGSSKNGLP